MRAFAGGGDKRTDIEMKMRLLAAAGASLRESGSGAHASREAARECSDSDTE